MSALAMLAAVALGLAFLFYRAVQGCLTPKPIKGIPFEGKASTPLGDLPGLLKAIWARVETDRYKYGRPETLQVTGYPFDYFEDFYKKHGPIAQVLLWPRPLVLVFDPAARHEVLDLNAKHFDRSADNIRVFSAVIPRAMIAQRTDERFRAHRRALAPAISGPYLAFYTPNAIHCARQLVQIWEAKRRLFGDSPFSVREDLFISLKDNIGLAVFGETFGGADSVLSRLAELSRPPPPSALGAYDDVLPTEISELSRANDYVATQLGGAFFAPVKSAYLFYQQLWPRWRHSKRSVMTYLRDRVEATRARMAAEAVPMSKPKCVLDMLIEKERSGGVQLEMADLLDELWSLIVAGSDTSSGSLMYFLDKLSRHGDVQRQLHSYLLEKLPVDRDFGFADLASDNLPYLEAVLSELLRFDPVAPASVRDTLVETTILGSTIPAGTVVICANAAMTQEEEPEHPYDMDEARKQRGCGYWARGTANKFQPERWLRPDGSFDGRAGPLFKFSSGVRGCWGRSIAMGQLKVFLVILNLAFYFEELPVELHIHRSTLRPANVPTTCYIRPRRWDEMEWNGVPRAAFTRSRSASACQIV